VWEAAEVPCTPEFTGGDTGKDVEAGGVETGSLTGEVSGSVPLVPVDSAPPAAVPVPLLPPGVVLEADSGSGRRFACSFFHFMRRFWNQILMCLSVRLSMAASSILRGREMYLLK